MKNIPRRITIDTNPDQCNLKCIMCDTHSIYNKNRAKRKRMSPELLAEVLQQAVDLGVEEIIPSTMGEPLLYPYFDIFIEKLTNTSTKLNLTTNGTFPKKGAEVWAKLLLPITTDTKISINAISPRINGQVMIKVNTEQAIKNIQTYLEIRDKVREEGMRNPTVTLQVTFMKCNLSGIKEVIEFAVKNNVDRVKGHHLWVTHPELKQEDLRNPANEGLWDNFIKDIEDYRDLIKLENFVPLKKGQGVVPESYSCPFLGKELWIDCGGNYNVCCAPSERRKALGDFGNFNHTAIENVFGMLIYQNLLTNYKQEPLCNNCLLRKPD